MRLIAQLVILSFIYGSVKAQTLSLEQWDGHPVPGAYYKDLNNKLDSFEGTYIYTNGTSSIKLVLEKKSHSSVNGVYSEDILVGEIRIVENGVEQLNTLSLLNQAQSGPHTLIANAIITGPSRICQDCSSNEVVLQGAYLEPGNKFVASLTLRKTTQNSQQAITFEFYYLMTTRKQSEPISEQPKLKGSGYILIKQ